MEAVYVSGSGPSRMYRCNWHVVYNVLLYTRLIKRILRPGLDYSTSHAQYCWSLDIAKEELIYNKSMPFLLKSKFSIINL